MRRILLLLTLFLAACSSAATPLDSPSRSFTYYAAPGTEKVIPDLYDCADRTRFGLAARTPNINQADLIIRLTAPQSDIAAYQVGTMELVLAANLAATSVGLSLDQVKSIYTGKTSNWAEVGGTEAEIQVWAYGADNDLQKVFSETMLTEGSLTSNARQVQDPRKMRDALVTNENAVGILPRAEVRDDLHILSAINIYPVLVLVSNEAKNDLSSIIHCLQSN